jgi:Heparinase II/III-like protein/Heparinase II/III N-terminus
MPHYGRRFAGPSRDRKLSGKFILDWRDCADSDFVGALRPASAKLKKALKLWELDREKSRRLIVEHFLGRAKPLWAFDFRKKRAEQLPSRNFFFDEAIDIRKARRSLRYEFYDYNETGSYLKLTPKVDWARARCHLLGSAGWLTMGFAYWALFPAAGYAMTRNRRYAEVFANCWRRWFQTFPTRATDAGLDGFFAFNTLDPAGLDNCMHTGRRALVMVDVLYSGLLDAANVDLAFEVVKYIWFVSDLFRRAFEARGERPDTGAGNHTLFDRGTVPFSLGTLFPEFGCAAALRRRGRAVLRWHASDAAQGAIRPDGTSWEHSARYAWYAANMFRQALELARLNREPLFARTEERRVLDFLETFADLTAPDGEMVPWGDCQPPRSGCHLELARSLITGSRAENIARRLKSATRVHAPARRKARKTPQGEASRFFPDSGILVARTGWRPTDSLLFVTAEPRATYSGHSHHDFGSFQLWCDGVPIFYDAATWAYRIDRIIPAERGYYYSAFSHNLLTEEDYRPRAVFHKMGNVLEWWGDEDNPPVKTERTVLDGPRGVLAVSHRAYPDMVVRRTYRFDLAERWLEITDRVTASKRAERTLRQWLHLAFGVRARVLAGGELVAKHKGVEARCSWSSDQDLLVDLEPSREVLRAARVFKFAKPLRAYAESVTRASELEISCRVEWASG